MPWNDPLLPQSWIQPAQDALQPGLNTSPTMAKLKGFGAGALEGLRNLTTPTNLAMTALPWLREAGAGAEAAETAMPAIRSAYSLVQPGEVAQAMPKTADVDLAINALRRGLSNVPSAR